jgi:hypothetical protein
VFITEEDILWKEGDNGGHLLNEEESDYSEFAFILIKCVNDIALVIAYAYLNSVMLI